MGLKIVMKAFHPTNRQEIFCFREINCTYQDEYQNVTCLATVSENDDTFIHVYKHLRKMILKSLSQLLDLKTPTQKLKA